MTCIKTQHRPDQAPPRLCRLPGLLFLALSLAACGSTHAMPRAGQSAALSQDSVALSARAFFAEFGSPDEQRRHAARLYLLGVLDATEGRAWCDYKTLKTVSLHEHLYGHFRKLPPQRLDERASDVITEALALAFPCKPSR